MARPRSRGSAPANPVRRPAPRLIGFIGRATVTDFEAAVLRYVGQCLAALGHTLVIVPAKGACAAMREGVEVQGGEVRTLTAGVLHVADRILLYPDPPLLKRLEATYKDLHERENVVIINEDEIEQWPKVMRQILDGYGVPHP